MSTNARTNKQTTKQKHKKAHNKLSFMEMYMIYRIHIFLLNFTLFLCFVCFYLYEINMKMK